MSTNLSHFTIIAHTCWRDWNHETLSRVLLLVNLVDGGPGHDHGDKDGEDQDDGVHGDDDVSVLTVVHLHCAPLALHSPITPIVAVV